MNHVFMDFENVHQIDLTLIGARSVSFTLMVGPQQGRLDAVLVEKLMEHSASVRLVKLKSKAKNALDFALAYYLGRAAVADPTAYFHLIAKDTGYDPLIEHLRDRHINVRRHATCAELTFTWPGKKPAVTEPMVEKPVAKKVAAKKGATKAVAKKVAAKKKVNDPSPDAGYQRVWDNFQKTPTSLPVRRNTLLAKIGHLIGEKADGRKVTEIVKRLENAGVLTFDEKDHPKYSF